MWEKWEPIQGGRIPHVLVWQADSLIEYWEIDELNFSEHYIYHLTIQNLTRPRSL